MGISYTVSIPWAEDEYIMVDGRQCVYDKPVTDQSLSTQLRVRFPGGDSATVEELLRAGRDVVLPKRMRRNGH